MLKVIQIIDKITDKILIIFCLILFLIGGYVMYDTVLIYEQANNEDLRSFRPIKVNEEEFVWDMSALSEDTIAWITVDKTYIDYPILQSNDNIKYLSTDPFGKYSLCGSIFLDYRNASDFSDNYSLIYGHHMDYNKMFGALDEFVDKNYFDEHRTGTLIVGQELLYNIKFFAFLYTDASVDEIFVPDSELDILGYVRENAKIFYEPEGKQLIALSTCKSPTSTERTVLFCTVVK